MGVKRKVRQKEGFTTFLRSGSIIYSTTLVIICLTQTQIEFCQLISWLGECDLQDVHWRWWCYTGSGVFKPEVTLRNKFSANNETAHFFPKLVVTILFTHQLIRNSMEYSNIKIQYFFKQNFGGGSRGVKHILRHF